MDVNDDVLNMPKGWVVSYEDGTIITEYDRDGKECNWRKIPKVGIKSVSIKWYGKHWTIHGKQHYFQKKRGWVNPAIPGAQEANVETRCIGYWEGNDKIMYVVDEITGDMKIVVESIG